MVVLIKILQTILAFSVLIIVHELGHFFFAKLFKIRVEKFYLFFDAGFALLRFKPKNSETEYGIGWLPLGGYCKIAGMIDESMDTEQMKKDPQPWEFRSKPAWQRFLVMFGGVLFNFILAMAVYALSLGIWGETYISNEGNSVYVNELAYDMGFRTGDEILSIDDCVPEEFYMLQADMVRRTAQKVTVLRDGDTLDIYLDQSRLGEMINSPMMFSLALPFVADSIPPTALNYGNIVKGDRILSIDGTEIDYVQDARPLLAENAGGEVNATILRGRDTISQVLQVDSLGMIGVPLHFDGIKTHRYNALEAVPAGVKMAFTQIGDYAKDLKLLVTPGTEAYKSVGSFITIGQVFPSAWDWQSFLNILALLSIMLGVMNLLPIPALDGGHIVFTLYEMITGKKPSDKFLMGAQMIGMLLLVALMFLALGNDIARLFN